MKGGRILFPPVCCPVPLSGTQTAGWKGRGWLVVGAGLDVGWVVGVGLVGREVVGVELVVGWLGGRW